MEKPTAVAEGKLMADMPVAKFISKHVDLQVGLGKNQRQIAQEVGYEQPNIISMFKSGTAKVPFAKIPALLPHMVMFVIVAYDLNW